jgi:hypothetical protein
MSKNKKSLGCKQWVAIGLALLRFLWGQALDPPNPLGIFPLGPPLILRVWGGRGPGSRVG